ncbi:MAG: ftsH4 1 [Planctomycetaceae bacterium]|nr:ftsH4 1 [Planctomycetaceae bacterium]
MSTPEDPKTPPPELPPGRSNGSKNERPGLGVLPLVLIGLLLLTVLFGGFADWSGPVGEEVAISEFMSGLESGKLGPHNVYKAKFFSQVLKYQDKPDPKAGWLGLWPANEGSETKQAAATPEAAPKAAEHAGKGAAEEKTAANTLHRYYVPLVGLSEDTPQLTKLMRDKKIVFTTEKPTSDATILFYLWGPAILLLVLGYFLLRKLTGASAAMSFSRSRGKIFAQEDLGITFDDVAGIDEAKEELREIVGFLRNPQKYQALGGRIPRGVLLVGPPGTGKTLLAKAVAGEAGVPFFSLSGSDFVELYVGVGAARVRDMFAQAGQKSPSIIFIDELDALGKVRGGGAPGGHDERDQTLNALLVEMDGFPSDQSVIVMGATNRPETLDPALMRGGRFDRHVLVDRPDVKGREAILKVHMKKIKSGSDVDMQYLAKQTPGFVGADLASMVNEAALLAARKDKSVVNMPEFEEGIERVIVGLEKISRIISPEEKLRVAYHECGHALVGCSLPHTDPIVKISIIPRGLSALGYTRHCPEDDRHLVTQTELFNRICMYFGGIVAEEIIYNETSTGASDDLKRATDIALRMITEFGMSPKLGRVNYRTESRSPFLNAPSGGSDHWHSEATVREIDTEVKRIIDEANTTVLEILTARRAVLEHMTRELVEKEIMDAAQLKKILDEHSIMLQIKPGTHATLQREVDTDVAASPSRKPLEGV